MSRRFGDRFLGVAVAVLAGVLLLPFDVAGQPVPAGPPPYRVYAPGLLVATDFVFDGASPYHIESWSLLIGPGLVSRDVTLPGGAIVDVSAGAGLLTIAGKTQELRGGSTVGIDQGERFSLDNAKGAQPLMLHAVVFARKP